MVNQKVSIIIPLFNAGKFLDETVYSVLNQSYSNIEIVIIDDNSTDDSYYEALKFQSCRVIVKQNIGKGACAARNYGFSLSSGDYIQFLDADDLLSPEKIERQMEVLTSINDDSIASGIWGRFYHSKDEVVWENQKVNKNFNPAYLWLMESWKGGGMGQTAIWLTPRKLIEKAGGWNESLQINQDGEFFSRVLMIGQQVVFCEEAKVYYRSGNPNSISQDQKFSREKAESLLLSYQLYLKHANDFGLIDNLKEGLGYNFLEFMYQFYGQFKDLVDIAEQEFYDLEYHNMWPVGGDNFKKLASIVGFKTALKLKHIYDKN